MDEAPGNSTAPPRDARLVLRLSSLALLAVAVASLPDARRRALDDAAPRALVAPPGAVTAHLRGRVLTEDGAPVRGARVLALLLRDGLSWRLGDPVTDVDGRFDLPALPRGDVQLVVTAPGLTRALLRLRLAAGVHDAPTLRLGPAARVQGVVLANRGDAQEPLAGALVRAVREGGDADWPFVARADAQGRFTLDGMPAGGTWEVELDAPGYERTRRLGVLAPQSALSLVARALATVEGVVRDAHGEAATSAEVTISGSGIWPARRVPVLHDGRFLLQDVPAGVYEVRARRDDDVADPVAPLLLEPGGREDVTLRLLPGATVSGVVRDALSGGGVEGAQVVVTEDGLSMSPLALRSDAGGRFARSGLLRRGHRVSVYAPGYAPQQGVVAAPDVALDVRLDRGVTVDGRLIDGRGAPVSGARVELHVDDLDGRAVWWNGATVAFREALFSAQARGPRPLEPRGELGVTTGRVPWVPLEPVPVGVEVERSAPGWVTDADGRFHLTEVPPGVLRVSVNHVAYVRAESVARSARPGEAVSIELVAHEGGSIEGRVLTDRGFPLSGAQVELRAESEPVPRRVFTARDGSYRAPALLGRVTLVAWVQGRVAARAEALVGDGATEVVNLTVPGSLRRVQGRVVDARGFGVGGATLSLTSLERAALGTVQTFTEPDGTFDTVLGGTQGVSIEVRHPEHAPRGLRVDDVSRPLRIELSAGASLTLRVAHDGCAEGEGVAELRGACGPARTPVVDGGETRFDRQCPGRATLVVDLPGCVRLERAVTVPAAGELSLGPLELRAGGGAQGEVVDADGEPVAGAVLSLEGHPEEPLGRTGRRGEFTVPSLPQGDVSLEATHPSLGASAPVTVRVLRGTVARGVLLRMERSARDGARAVMPRAVALEEGEGVTVRGVLAGSAAERAGLRAGDRVVSVGATTVTTVREAERRMTGPPGDEVVLEVERDGRRRTVRFVRESR